MKYERTEPVQSITEYLAVYVARRDAFEQAGNVGALLDELQDASDAVLHTIVKNRPAAEKRERNPGTPWEGHLPHDPITLSAWAYEASYDLLGPSPLKRAMRSIPDVIQRAYDGNATVEYWAFMVLVTAVRDLANKKRRRGQDADWWGEYKNAQVDWHRYVLADRKLTGGWSRRDSATNDGAFSEVAAALRGTRFAGAAPTIEASYDRVRRNIDQKLHGRYYRVSSFPWYQSLVTHEPIPAVALLP